MRFHWLRLRATAHPSEVPERVRRAVQTVTGLDDEAFAQVEDATRLDGHHGADVTLVEATLTRSQDVRAWARRIAADHADGILADLDARTDDDGVLYLRFEKQDALAGRLVLTRGDDCVQVRIRPEVHPASRAAALDALGHWLTTGEA